MSPIMAHGLQLVARLRHQERNWLRPDQRPDGLEWRSWPPPKREREVVSVEVLELDLRRGHPVHRRRYGYHHGAAADLGPQPPSIDRIKLRVADDPSQGVAPGTDPFFEVS